MKTVEVTLKNGTSFNVPVPETVSDQVKAIRNGGMLMVVEAIEPGEDTPSCNHTLCYGGYTHFLTPGEYDAIINEAGGESVFSKTVIIDEPGFAKITEWFIEC